MWTKLHFVGILDAEQDGSLELRNCPCGSTIAVECAASPNARAARAFDACAVSEELRARLRELVPTLLIFGYRRRASN